MVLKAVSNKGAMYDIQSSFKSIFKVNQTVGGRNSVVNPILNTALENVSYNILRLPRGMQTYKAKRRGCLIAMRFFDCG